tara:strand:+ start:2862 stop:3095 length:234 start_codon:yes stop_codon:yes gene_type:complete
MSEGYSRVMRSASGKSIPREDSFRELKKMVDEGYERFWNMPHRRHLRPQSPDHGSFLFSGSEDYGHREREEECDSLT